jgi:glycosyltransferase involved in cell wall biosynthesis
MTPDRNTEPVPLAHNRPRPDRPERRPGVRVRRRHADLNEIQRPSRASRRLRIAVVAPPWYELPPRAYGGIESMCHSLVEGLVERGHHVTVVGSGEARTSARFAPTFSEPPTELGAAGEAQAEVVHAAIAGKVLADLRPDVVHDHSTAGPLTAGGRSAPTVLTAHGPVPDDLARCYRALGLPVVAISNAQRALYPSVPWHAVVHNGVEVATYPFSPNKGDFVLFMGRMCADKAPHLAIEVARRAGLPIVLAGKCTAPAERSYFDAEVRPRLGPDVDWVGEADAAGKRDLYTEARALVFPLQWDEPFGIVMVEALACGTPVVALRKGSVPEVVDDGVTGFIRDHVDELPACLDRVSELDPRACRDAALHRFDASVMVAGYEAVYHALVDERALDRASLPARVDAHPTAELDLALDRSVVAEPAVSRPA